jgi:copper transport protein
MLSIIHTRSLRRALLISVPLALLAMLLLPAVASANSSLLRSNPVGNALLSAPPQRVQMWFTEDLNPVFSTAVVVNAANKRVDNGDARVSSSDPTEMDLTLAANLPPGVYVVIYRSDSAVDGYTLRGSFLFTVENPDGSAPTLSPGAHPGANVLGGTLTGQYTGQIDGPTFFDLVMVTLVELGAVFWVGAQLWLNFVLQLSAEKHPEERELNERVEQRFAKWFSLPTLLVLLIANIGVLIGQAIFLTGGDWGQALAPQLLAQLATTGRFGVFWLLREAVIVLAALIALFMLVWRNLPGLLKSTLPLVNLLLGTVLFIAITMSGSTATVGSNVLPLAIVVDWLHLLAAALWIGGMLYIAAIYLPVLRRRNTAEQARSLTTLLPFFTPLVIAGIIILTITGPFNATFHMTSWSQLLDTAYGRTLLVKIVLVGGLLITSVLQMGLLQPRVKKEHQKYRYAVNRLAAMQLVSEKADNPVAAISVQQETAEASSPVSSSTTPGAPATHARGSGNETLRDEPHKMLAQQIRLREKRLESKTRRLTSLLRWEPLLGIAVIVCVGLMNAFGGTLNPPPGAQQQQPTNTPVVFTTTVTTTDGKFNVKLVVNPNRFGTNVFTVSVTDKATGQPVTNIGVTLFDTMLDMDMGTDNVSLPPDGKGHFSARGELSMAGNWQIRVSIRTADNTLHEATVKLYTPF